MGEASLTSMDKQMTIDRIKRFEGYFLTNIKNNILFKPEFEAAKEINLILNKREIDKGDLLKITDIFNLTNKGKHYNGSGWMDLGLLIQGLIRSHGLHVDMKNNDIIIIA